MTLKEKIKSLYYKDFFDFIIVGFTSSSFTDT